MTIQPNEAPGPSEKKPRRSTAALLGVFGPWGTGQFYLGQTWSSGALAHDSLRDRHRVRHRLAPAWERHRVRTDLWRARDRERGHLDGLVERPSPHSGRAVATCRRPEVLGYWVAGIVFTVAVRLPIRAVLIEAFKIPAGSMQANAARWGSPCGRQARLLRPEARAWERSSSSSFRSTEDQDFRGSEVIAIPGDKLDVKNGHPWLNGWEVPHCVVGQATMPSGEGRISSARSTWNTSTVAPTSRSSTRRRAQRRLSRVRSRSRTARSGFSGTAFRKQQPRLALLVRRSRRRRPVRPPW